MIFSFVSRKKDKINVLYKKHSVKIDLTVHTTYLTDINVYEFYVPFFRGANLCLTHGEILHYLYFVHNF